MRRLAIVESMSTTRASEPVSLVTLPEYGSLDCHCQYLAQPASSAITPSVKQSSAGPAVNWLSQCESSGTNGGASYSVRGFNTLGSYGYRTIGISGAQVSRPVSRMSMRRMLRCSSWVSTNGNGTSINVTATAHRVWCTAHGINAANGNRGLDVRHSGVGTGVFGNSDAGGTGRLGRNSEISISAAGVIGDNSTGEAIVGRSQEWRGHRCGRRAQ